MSKTLLVLAASTYQLPTIRTARSLGYRVVTTDNVPSNPGHALADASHQVDTTDQYGVLRLAEKERISGVIAPATDVAVETAAYVAEQLGLPGPGVQAARTLTRKREFRDFLRNAGLPCPRVVEPDHGLNSDALFRECRWVVKPNRSSGSKGVFVVSSARELAMRLDESRRFSADGQALLEEFVTGTQHTCEGLLRGGKLVVSMITDRETAALPHTATRGHRVPTNLSGESCRQAVDAIECLLELTHVTDGPVDCDFVAGERGIVLIEITPRLGGNSLSQLFLSALNVDLVAAAIRHACGDEFSVVPAAAPAPAAVVILGTGKAGRVHWDRSQADLLSREPWVRSLLFDVSSGDAVRAFANGRDRVGEALITARSRDDLDRYVVEFSRRLRLEAADS